MKYFLFIFFFLSFFVALAQPKTDCVCNGSSAGGGKFYAGAGGDFHLAFFENDDYKFKISTLGIGGHIGYNFDKKLSLQLGIQKYGLDGIHDSEKFTGSARYSYLDLSLLGVYRFLKRGSRFIPYLQIGYTLNSTLKKNYEAPNENLSETGFQIQGHYAHLGGGMLFVLVNNFTLYSEAGMWIHPTAFGTNYVFDIFKFKPGISVGVNYHF